MRFRGLFAAGFAALGLATVLLFGFLVPAVALPANKNPAAVQAGTYVVEPVHTRILFAIAHMGFTTWYGNFFDASGSLTLDPKQLSSTRLDITLPVASISTTNAKLDGELKGADWFDASRYPTAHFVSRKIVSTGPASANVMGVLTLHGVTQPEVLHVTFNGAGINPLDKKYTVGFNARAAIRRSDFGVTKYPGLLGDNVELILSAAFERKEP